VDAFLNAGARVCSIDARERREGPSGEYVSVLADLSDPAEIENAFAELGDSLGAVDILIQAAGVVDRKSFLDTQAADIDRVYAINVRTVLLTARLAAQDMIARGQPGSIVNISSTAASNSEGTAVSYDMSRGAIDAATRSMAVALAPWGIRVNAVAPGSMAKPQDAPQRDVRDLDAYEARRIPLARHGLPIDIARAAVFLATAADYVTGVVLPVDGGALAKW
jgi:NAD(P)-dependent dehydrogenase (short-subunit alcohol dehydrogenase family)